MQNLLVRVAVDAPAGYLRLARHDRRNAISRRLLADFAQGLDDLHGEKSVRAVVITTDGDDFCSGADLAEIHEYQQDDEGWKRWQQDATLLRDFMERLLRYPKPLIAATRGNVAGLGVALTLCCDVVLAASDTRFSFPEITRGLAPGVTAPLLTFRLGASQASRMLLTAAEVPAEEASRLGLCHETLPGIELEGRAQAVAERVATGAAEAVQLTRKLLNETVAESVYSQLSAGVAAMATARTTEAAAEGVAAFVEKRAPEWP